MFFLESCEELLDQGRLLQAHTHTLFPHFVRAGGFMRDVVQVCLFFLMMLFDSFWGCKD